MADICADLAAEHGVPVVEGVSAAVRLAEAMVVLGLKTAKTGGWAFPRAKG
jgi:allantoin racemase